MWNVVKNALSAQDQVLPPLLNGDIHGHHHQHSHRDQQHDVVERSPEEIEEMVLHHGEYHQALLIVGYQFQPGDDSWAEWIFLQIYHHYHQYHPPFHNSTNGDGDNDATTVMTAEEQQRRQQQHAAQEFLVRASRLLSSAHLSSREELDRHWTCFHHLCSYYQQTIWAYLFYSHWLSTPLEDTIRTMAQRGDIGALQVVFHFFPPLAMPARGPQLSERPQEQAPPAPPTGSSARDDRDVLWWLDELNPVIPVSEYAFLILNSNNSIDWAIETHATSSLFRALRRHIHQRFQLLGSVDDWIVALQQFAQDSFPEQSPPHLKWTGLIQELQTLQDGTYEDQDEDELQNVPNQDHAQGEPQAGEYRPSSTESEANCTITTTSSIDTTSIPSNGKSPHLYHNEGEGEDEHLTMEHHPPFVSEDDVDEQTSTTTLSCPSAGKNYQPSQHDGSEEPERSADIHHHHHHQIPRSIQESAVDEQEGGQAAPLRGDVSDRIEPLTTDVLPTEKVELSDATSGPNSDISEDLLPNASDSGDLLPAGGHDKAERMIVCGSSEQDHGGSDSPVQNPAAAITNQVTGDDEQQQQQQPIGKTVVAKCGIDDNDDDDDGGTKQDTNGAIVNHDRNKELGKNRTNNRRPQAREENLRSHDLDTTGDSEKDIPEAGKEEEVESEEARVHVDLFLPARDDADAPDMVADAPIPSKQRRRSRGILTENTTTTTAGLLTTVLEEGGEESPMAAAAAAVVAAAFSRNDEDCADGQRKAPLHQQQQPPKSSSSQDDASKGTAMSESVLDREMQNFATQLQGIIKANKTERRKRKELTKNLQELQQRFQVLYWKYKMQPMAKKQQHEGQGPDQANQEQGTEAEKQGQGTEAEKQGQETEAGQEKGGPEEPRMQPQPQPDDTSALLSLLLPDGDHHEIRDSKSNEDVGKRIGVTESSTESIKKEKKLDAADVISAVVTVDSSLENQAKATKLKIRTLEDQLRQLQEEYDLQSTADRTRIEYLEDLLYEEQTRNGSLLSSLDSGSIATMTSVTAGGTATSLWATPSGSFRRTPPASTAPSVLLPSAIVPATVSYSTSSSPPTAGGAGMTSRTNGAVEAAVPAPAHQELQKLALALEHSERQRAQALEDLQHEREMHAEKLRQLKESFSKRLMKVTHNYATALHKMRQKSSSSSSSQPFPATKQQKHD